jgi:tetratricopeptide (TPR) repeat protein
MAEIWYAAVCAACAALSFLSLRPRFIPTPLLRLLILVEAVVLWWRPLLAFSGDLADSRGLPPILIVLLPPALFLPFAIITAIHLMDEFKFRFSARIPVEPTAGSGGQTPIASDVAFQLEAALRVCQKKLKRNPQDAEANLRTAEILGRLKRYPEAAAHYEAATANFSDEPRKVEAALKGADMMDRMGKSAQAVMLLNGLRAGVQNNLQRMLLDERLKFYQQAETFRGGWAGPAESLKE